MFLDFFSGSGSVARAARSRGLRTRTTDIEQFGEIDCVADILTLDIARIPHGQIAWFSPPCEAFSVASISHHWQGGKEAYIPKSEHAKLSIRLVERIWEIIDAIQYEARPNSMHNNLLSVWR